MRRISYIIQLLLLLAHFATWVAYLSMAWGMLFLYFIWYPIAKLPDSFAKFDLSWCLLFGWMFASGAGLFSLWELLFCHIRYAKTSVPRRTFSGIVFGFIAIFSIMTRKADSSLGFTFSLHLLKEGEILFAIPSLLILQFSILIADLRQQELHPPR